MDNPHFQYTMTTENMILTETFTRRIKRIVICEKQITAHQQAMAIITSGEESIFFISIETIVALFIKHMLDSTSNSPYKRCPFNVLMLDN